MGKDILYRVGNGGHCGCETVSREVLPQVEIPEKWTQEPPCFAITIWCAIKIAHQLSGQVKLGNNNLIGPLTLAMAMAQGCYGITRDPLQYYDYEKYLVNSGRETMS